MNKSRIEYLAGLEGIKETLTEEQQIQGLFEMFGKFGMFGKFKMLLKAFHSFVNVMPHIESLLAKASSEDINNTIELLSDIMQHKRELQNMASALPELKKVMIELAKVMPYKEEHNVPPDNIHI